MKKKIILTLLVLVCTLCCAVGLTACDFGGGPTGGNGGTSGNGGFGDEGKIVEVQSIALNKTAIALRVGDEETLTVTFTPVNTTDKRVSWWSDDDGVAKVNDDGKVTAVAEGETVIWVGASKTALASCRVTVTDSLIDPVEVTSIELSITAFELMVGGTHTLNATILPDNATNKTVTWKIDKPEIATVDNAGKVTAIAEGTAKITVTSINGITATCTLTVKASAPVVTSPSLQYKLNDDKASYTVTGKGTVTALDIVIPSEYEGLPVTAIGNNAFAMTSVKSVEIPNSVTTIGAYALAYCNSLTSIEIPDSVTTVENYAFSYCKSLTSVTVGKGVTEFGSRVFCESTALNAVYISDLTAWCNIKFVAAWGSNPLYYAHNLYLNGELVTEVKIDESITALTKYVFQSCTPITSMVIHDGVTEIEYNALAVMPNLKIYYEGTQEQWGEIAIDTDNNAITGENVYYYSEEAPTDEGYYWHYDTDGVTPVIWSL